MQLPAFERRSSGGSPRSSTDRDAVHDERRRGIEVREDEDADGAADRRSDAARRPDAGLVALRHHPGSGADGSLGDGSASGGSDRASDVLGLDLHDPSLREPAVVALADDGDDEVLRADARLGVHGHANRAVVDAADRMGGREVHGRLDAAPVGDLQRPGELARAVQDCRAGWNRLGVQRLDRTRQYGGDAGAGDPSSSGRVGLVAPDRDVADRDPRDVGDRIRRACFESSDVEAELAEARPT